MNIRKYKANIFIILISLVQVSFGSNLHKDIQKIYNFKRHTISKEEQVEKAKLMDEFWKKVTNDTGKYLKDLRKELKDTTNPVFFFYDGGHLLIQLTTSVTDYQIALNAINRVDLDDVDLTD